MYIKQYKKHSTNSTKHGKYKYTYYQNTHTLQNQLKQPQYKIHTKWNSHNTIKYPQYKVTLMYMVLLSPRTTKEKQKFYWLPAMMLVIHVGGNAEKTRYNKLKSLTLRLLMSYIYGAHILDVSRSHTTHHSRYDSSGRVISSSQRPLPDNTRHS